MKTLLFIASGGAIGAVLRYLLSNSVYNIFGRSFPYGTLSVNVLGSFIIGIAYVVLIERLTDSQDLRSIIIIGFLGAFTTFSTFSIDTLLLLQQGETFKALLNIGLSVVLCVSAAWLGMVLANNYL